MKRKPLILLLASMIIISGCGGNKVNTKTEPGSAVEEAEAAENQSDIKENDAVTERDSMQESEDITEQDGMQESEDITNLGDEQDSEDVTEQDNAQETEGFKQHLRDMKELHNLKEVDFEPTIGEFCELDESGLDVITTADGSRYGFYDDLTEGCSVWCAVNNYEVSIEATSTLAPQGNQSYEAENILSGTRSNAWVEGVPGDGIGEKITITKTYEVALDESLDDEESIFFYEMCIVNGLARTDKTWKENGRVKTLAFYFNDEYMGDLELEDTMKPQFISLSGLNLAACNKETCTFSFEIKDVYSGDKYDDTAITGIEIVFDTPNH